MKIKFEKAHFKYTSTCCKEPAAKSPCERSREDKKENKFSESSLGTWRCTRCKRKCSVTRSLNKKEKEAQEEQKEAA